MVSSITEIEIRYAETDLMGVVHHSHYPVYFEQGRTSYFQEHLKPYQFDCRMVSGAEFAEVMPGDA